MSDDKYQDSRVAATYRSLAGEKTPEYLDRKILEMAAAGVKASNYSRWMAWSRPLAWAATITLCLAITLELAREPALDPARSERSDVPASPAAMKSAAAPTESMREQEEPLRKDEDFAQELASQGDVAEAMADSIVAEKIDLRRSAPQPPADVAAPAARARQASAEFDEEKAKLANGAVRAEEQSLATSSVAAVSGLAEAQQIEVDECTAEQKSTAETWLACIDELESNNQDDAAQRQRNALKETFPDFKLP